LKKGGKFWKIAETTKVSWLMGHATQHHVLTFKRHFLMTLYGMTFDINHVAVSMNHDVFS